MSCFGFVGLGDGISVDVVNWMDVGWLVGFVNEGTVVDINARVVVVEWIDSGYMSPVSAGVESGVKTEVDDKRIT